jgi:predicted nucleic acid-binding Zn ribbon protein
VTGDEQRGPGSEGRGLEGRGSEGRGAEGHDPEGLDLAHRIAQATRGGQPASKPRRRKPGPAPSEGPEALGELIQGVIRQQGWSTEISLHHLLGRWPALVGPVNAEHSRPESYADRVLTVRAESTTWATSLRQIAPQLVAVLNEQLGQGTVERVVVIGPTAPSWKKGKRSVQGRGPRDTYG